jgi:hypothetical protein
MVEDGSLGGPLRESVRERRPRHLKKKSAHRIVQFFRFHSFDGLGRLVSISEVTSRPTLVDGDNPAHPERGAVLSKRNGRPTGSPTRIRPAAL